MWRLELRAWTGELLYRAHAIHDRRAKAFAQITGIRDWRGHPVIASVTPAEGWQPEVWPTFMARQVRWAMDASGANDHFARAHYRNRRSNWTVPTEYRSALGFPIWNRGERCKPGQIPPSNWRLTPMAIASTVSVGWSSS